MGSSSASMHVIGASIGGRPRSSSVISARARCRKLRADDVIASLGCGVPLAPSAEAATRDAECMDGHLGAASNSSRGAPRTRAPSLFVVGALLLLGCRQQMADQPRCEPFGVSSLFADGKCARDLPEG